MNSNSISELISILNSNNIERYENLFTQILSSIKTTTVKLQPSTTKSTSTKVPNARVLSTVTEDEELDEDSKNRFNFLELADLMSLNDHELFCGKLSKYIEVLIQKLNHVISHPKESNNGENENDDMNVEKTTDSLTFPVMSMDQLKNYTTDTVLKYLLKVSDVISLYTSSSFLKYRPPSLYVCINHLHNILIALDEKSLTDTTTTTTHHAWSVAILNNLKSLKLSVSKICEYWYIHNENKCEHYITQLIPYLLLNALKLDTKEQDIKRLYKIQTAFLLLDFEDDSIESIKNMLLRCVISPLFLKSHDGRKFLSFVFSIHTGLHPLILDVIKTVLSDGSVKVATALGEVLYYGWKQYAHLPSSASFTAAAGDDNHNNSPYKTSNTHTGKSKSTTNNNKDSSSSSSSESTTITSSALQQQQQQQLQERDSLEECIQTLVHDAIHAAESKYFKALRVLLR